MSGTQRRPDKHRANEAFYEAFMFSGRCFSKEESSNWFLQKRDTALFFLKGGWQGEIEGGVHMNVHRQDDKQKCSHAHTHTHTQRAARHTEECGSVSQQTRGGCISRIKT